MLGAEEGLLTAGCAVLRVAASAAAVVLTGVVNAVLSALDESVTGDTCAVIEDGVCRNLEDEPAVLVLKEPMTPPRLKMIQNHEMYFPLDSSSG